VSEEYGHAVLTQNKFEANNNTLKTKETKEKRPRKKRRN